jgi:hypothetical protein
MESSVMKHSNKRISEISDPLDSLAQIERALVLERRRNLILKQRNAIEYSKIDIFNKRVSSICSSLKSMKDLLKELNEDDQPFAKHLMSKTLETFVQTYETTPEISGEVSEAADVEEEEQNCIENPVQAIEDMPVPKLISNSSNQVVTNATEITIKGEAASMKINLSQEDCKKVGKIAVKLYRLHYGKDPPQKQTCYGLSNLYTIDDREIVRNAIEQYHSVNSNKNPTNAPDISRYLTTNT